MKSFLLLPILLLFSCSNGDPKKEKDEQEKEKKPVVQKRIIGRITSVSSTGNFVLFQKYGTGSLPKEAIFQSQGSENRQASLRPSGERVRDFFAADLLNGTAKIGDAVLAYHAPKKVTPPIEDEDPTDKPEASNAQKNNKKSDD